MPIQPDVAILIATLEGGGAERLVLTLAAEMVVRGLRVDLVVLDFRGDLVEHVPAGIRVVALGAKKLRYAPKLLTQYFRKNRPRSVLSNLWELNIIAVLSKITSRIVTTLVLVEHSVLSKSVSHRKKWQQKAIAFVVRWLYPRANQVVVVSYGAADNLSEFSGLPRSLIQVIYNGIPPVSRTPCPVPAKWSNLKWLQPNVQRILSVGTMKPVKDFSTLLKAFQQCSTVRSDLRLLILGDGPDRRFLEREVEGLGLSGLVEMPGFIPALTPFYQAANLFVLSSRWEGFGNVIVEALSAGLPVIAADSGTGPGEILKSGRYGRLFAPQDHRALASLILEQMGQTPDREVLRQRAGDFSVDRALEAYLNCLFPEQGGVAVGAATPTSDLDSAMLKYGPNKSLNETVEQVNKLYHAREANNYDSSHPEIYESLPKYWEAMVAKVIDTESLPQKLSILDFGCGTGFEAMQVVRILGPERIAKIVCYDLSAEMMDIARSNLAGQCFDIQFIRDIRDLDPATEQFEILLTNSLLHHLPDPYSTIGQLSRYLKPGSFWIAGHEPSVRHWKNEECRQAYLYYLNARKWKRFFDWDSLVRFVKRKFFPTSDLRFQVAEDAVAAGIFQVRPDPHLIGQLVDYHVCHHLDETSGGRGFDHLDFQERFKGQWELVWFDSYNYLGSIAEVRIRDRNVLAKLKRLKENYPLDGANFCCVWRMN